MSDIIDHINYDTISILKNAFPATSEETVKIFDLIVFLITTRNQRWHYHDRRGDMKLYSTALAIVSQYHKFPTKDITRLLKKLVRYISLDIEDWKKMDFYWLDNQIKHFGYKITTLQQQYLNDLEYTKSFLLLEPTKCTPTDLEHMFTITKVVSDILSKNIKDKQYIIDYIRKSKCKLTDICLINTFKVGIYIFTHLQPYESMQYMHLYDLIMNFFDLFNYKLTPDVASIILIDFPLKIYDDEESDEEIDIYKDNKKTLYHILDNLKTRNALLTIKHFCEHYYYSFIRSAINIIVKYIDFTKNVMTDDDVENLFNDTKNAYEDILTEFEKIKKLCKYKYTQRIFEYSIINNIEILFINILLENNTFVCTPICVKYAFLHVNKTFIEYVLEQKICPTINDIKFMFLHKKYSHIIDDITKLLGIYSVPLTNDIKELLTLRGYVSDVLIDKQDSDRLKYLKCEDVPITKSIVPIEVLRSMFRDVKYDSVNKIKKFIKLHNVTPDLYCFENAIISSNIYLINYVVTEYKYVPTIPIIMKCSPWDFAVTLLYHFYPELAKFHFIKNNEDKQIVVPVEKPYSDTDSEDEKPIKKTNKKTVVPKKQQDNTDSEGEKPIKKTNKKTVVPKKQSDTDSEEEKPIKKTKKRKQIKETNKGNK